MKRFRITHKYMADKVEEFDEDKAPSWLNGANSVPGSTMDGRWFWRDHVLALPVGKSIETEFRTITRIV